MLALQAANIASIAIGTAMRFLVYRAWVFPARTDDPAGADDHPGADDDARADDRPAGAPVLPA